MIGWLSVLASGAGGRSDQFASFDVHPWQWALFIALITTLLMVDLLVVHREAHVITFKEAAIESAVWIAIGLSFALVILGWQGHQAAGEYVTGYLIEESLSIDNVFVWAVILTYFRVPEEYQFRVLFWGIFGALVLRAGFIFAGVAVIDRFEAALVVFGLVLIYSAFKIAFNDDAQVDPESSVVLRIVRRLIPSTDQYDGQKLFTKRNLKRVATPLFAVLIMVETTDVIFAVDSIPAILAVANEQFIIFSSNAFAILGLRSLYFCVNGMHDRFRYLNVGLGVILASVGLKMLLSYFFDEWFHDHVPTWSSLVLIILVLTVTVLASLRAEQRETTESGGTKTD